MTKKTLVVGLLAMFSVTTFAQTVVKKIKDVRIQPDLYYLQNGQQASSLELLPTPPRPGSVQFLYDEAQYQWGKMQRNTPRGDQAAANARVGDDGVPDVFSEAFGIEIGKEITPEIYKLVLNMREDAGDLATYSAKDHYMRVRPFAFYNEMTCNPEQQQELSTNGSYPSGHAAIGWATTLVLSEINVDRQNEILERSYRTGQSRVICGYHWQSDVDAARVISAAVVTRLHAEPALQEQLTKAKKEFAELEKEGKIVKSTFKTAN